MFVCEREKGRGREHARACVHVYVCINSFHCAAIQGQMVCTLTQTASIAPQIVSLHHPLHVESVLIFRFFRTSQVSFRCRAWCVENRHRRIILHRFGPNFPNSSSRELGSKNFFSHKKDILGADASAHGADASSRCGITDLCICGVCVYMCISVWMCMCACACACSFVCVCV